MYSLVLLRNLRRWAFSTTLLASDLPSFSERFLLNSKMPTIFSSIPVLRRTCGWNVLFVRRLSVNCKFVWTSFAQFVLFFCLFKNPSILDPDELLEDKEIGTFVTLQFEIAIYNNHVEIFACLSDWNIFKNVNSPPISTYFPENYDFVVILFWDINRDKYSRGPFARKKYITPAFDERRFGKRCWASLWKGELKCLCLYILTLRWPAPWLAYP